MPLKPIQNHQPFLISVYCVTVLSE